MSSLTPPDIDRLEPLTAEEAELIYPKALAKIGDFTRSDLRFGVDANSILWARLHPIGAMYKWDESTNKWVGYELRRGMWWIDSEDVSFK